MVTERPEDSELLQFLDETRKRVQEEQAALDALSRERDRLRALRAERDRLLGELEGVARPEDFSLPFELPAGPRALSALLVARFWLFAAAFAFIYSYGLVVFLPMGLALLTFGLLEAGKRWREFPVVRFTETALEWREEHASSEPTVLLYADVLDARGRITTPWRQRKRGNVVVEYGREDSPQALELSYVPEPVRLAAWIRAKRDATP